MPIVDLCKKVYNIYIHTYTHTQNIPRSLFFHHSSPTRSFESIPLPRLNFYQCDFFRFNRSFLLRRTFKGWLSLNNALHRAANEFCVDTRYSFVVYRMGENKRFDKFVSRKVVACDYSIPLKIYKHVTM